MFAPFAVAPSARRIILSAAGVLSVLSCSDFTKPAAKQGGSLSLVPVFSTVALASGPSLSAVGLAVDHIRIVLHPDGDANTVLLDTTIAVAAGADSISLDLPVGAHPGETVDAAVSFESGTAPATVLFSGTAVVIAHAIGTTTNTSGD